jgi:GntR family transcriptional regulator
MEIRLNSSDGVPVYRQIMNQVKYLVASGRLRPGQELPAIRVLAERLVINPNTVVHAYGEVVREGVLVSRHGSGTFVAEGAVRVHPAQARRVLEEKVDSVLIDARQMNLGLEDVVRVVRERHGALQDSEVS